MGISVLRSGPGGANRWRKTDKPRARVNHFRGKILYPGLLWMLFACTLGAGIVASAQEERPHFTPGERKVPRKKDAGPRALGVLQMTVNGKVTLVPIAILVNGKFWDASAYKGTPVPMALEQGTVYEGERTGSSVGLFTVNSALHSKAVNTQAPWIATGSWLAQGKDASDKPIKAESVPVGIDTSDEPPRLSKNASSSSDKSAANKPGDAKSASDKSDKGNTPASPSGSSSTPSSSGDEPPRLTKPAPESGSGNSGSNQGAGSSPSSNQSAPNPGSTAPPDTKSPDAKPSEAKPKQSAGDKSTAAPKAPESDSGAAQGNRPRLRRGKPASLFADEDVPGYSKPGAKPSTDAKGAAPSQEIVDLVPAISDATSNDLHSFNFNWLKDEEGERRKQLTDMAKAELRTYLDAQAKSKSTTAPAGAKAALHAPPKKPAEPILENVRMTAYDLWGNNTPVIIFSADAHLPPPAAGTPHSDVESEIQYSLTLAVRPDIYDTVRKLYVGVTDQFHLDITPRLQLVDAVDADGDGRGELLFKQTSDAGTGWVLYRATADKLWKMFDSLSPE